jgi:hypothetical protein
VTGCQPEQRDGKADALRECREANGTQPTAFVREERSDDEQQDRQGSQLRREASPSPAPDGLG